MFKRIISFFAGIGILIAGGSVPVIEVSGTIVSSGVNAYETIEFDTDEGDIEYDEYAVAGVDEWYVRKAPKDEAGFTITEDPSDIEGKTLVGITCEKCKYFAFFQTQYGLERREITQEEYDTGEVPDFSGRVSLWKARTASAALGEGSDTDSGNAGAVSSYTFSHTVSSGSDLGLVVASTANDNGGDRVITGVTFNSDALTEAVGQNSSASNVRSYTSVWSIRNPDVTTANVEVTLTGTVNGGASTAINYTGVNQTDEIGATQTDDTTNSTAHTQDITTTEDGSYVIDTFSYRSGTVGATAGASQTEKEDVEIRAGGQDVYHAVSTESAPTAGTVTMSWTTGGSTDDSEHVMMELLAEPDAVVEQVDATVIWFD